MHQLTLDFAAIFEGNTEAYGLYTLTGETKGNGKQLGKALSINKKTFIELWDDHLTGKKGLGITPINKNSMVKFAAIDIDVYPLDIQTIAKKVHDLEIPVIPCRTKSGGVHLYMFLKQWTPAILVHKKLKEIASAVGYGTSDIYPRQTQLLSDRGDVGNWINLPYFNEAATTRYGVNAKGDALSLKVFLAMVNKVSIAEEDLVTLRWSAPDILPGGPPCLQQLCKQGFPEGTRNSGLMGLGVYAQKAFGEDWQAHVEDMNVKYMRPALSAEEVLSVIKSLAKKDYQYSCKTQPMQSFCNAAICRTCKFGVGNAEIGMPKMGTLTKIAAVPPIWFLDVETEGGMERIELTTDELQSPLLFQKRCMETLNIMPGVLKRESWTPIIQKLLLEVTIVDIPVEATPFGQLFGHLEYFCTSRATCKVIDELLLGKPYQHDGLVEFRLSDFLQFLSVKKFALLPLNKIASALKTIKGCGKAFHVIKGKGVNTYVLPLDIFDRQSESFNTLDQPKEVI